MSTDFNKNVIITSGSIRPSTIDTPTDTRTRIENLDEVELIPLPYIGMIFYVISEDVYYSVKSLKEKDINGTNIKKMVIDSYQKLIPEDEIIELRNMIKELTEMPEIVIANKNIESEMEYLNEKCKDENVIGIIIDPKMYSNSYVQSSYFEPDARYNFGLRVDFEFINNKITRSNSIIEDKIFDVERAFIKLKGEDVFNKETDTYIFKYNTSSYDNTWEALMLEIDSCNEFIFKPLNADLITNSFNFGFKPIEGKENLINTKEFFKKVFNDEAELKIYFVLHTFLAPLNPEISLNIKPFEIIYSTNVFFNKK